MDLAANIARTAELVREAAGLGAQVILPSELFQGPYFCVAQEERWFATAHPWREHPCVKALAPLAGELGVVIPISIFEREGPHYYNTVVIADASTGSPQAMASSATRAALRPRVLRLQRRVTSTARYWLLRGSLGSGRASILARLT